MKVVVLGAGESGVGTAVLAMTKGYDVFVSDFGQIEDKYKAVLNEFNVRWEEGRHTETEILSGDIIVKSPGIPDKVAIIQKALAADIDVISEIEFAYTFNTEPSVAITGSNGKTTTTMLTYHLLSKGGLNVGIGGNIGDSYAKQVAVNPEKCYVLELSSFQLDGIRKFRPHIAVITNISPDHLDRYDYKYENYINAKFRITLNQTKEDYLIYDDDDVEIQRWLTNNKTAAKRVPFSITKKLEYGAYLEGQNIVVAMDKETVVLPISELGVEGKHNVKNAMAATAVAQLKRIRKQSIRESLSDFQGAEHRLEKVMKVENVQYINDSKATNINATFFALESMKTPTVWIVGGVDKGNDYDELMPLVREKVKSIICLGVDNSKIKAAYEQVVDTLIEVQSMEDAVKMAQRLAESGDTVLLSPACASFDLFKNYEDRGHQFKAEVNNL
ncbi:MULTISPECIES: UDP-N-acetylmuramoyl-L-alanine--D-glutamate ligase [Myroides]|uniref:UDP-N-acetylmuramoylalanine--D-glutamate ligase n=3 Tax=Myroides odoratimimus TaxID=76832 RepID=A0A0S7ECQ0_9FLAO|nr:MULTISPECIES: UDP-N-acetylmuramoyl-L-alanine--D-glutamate ligase [Myroides]AJA67976.1 UDP-N-acetylmuramoylalanine--D-glutamate ligase [Myroides sp. A21]ALU25294.1 UDP-N-acetylmuramoylalanine--D-glutamate ligase [Myroides odoratimimus]APA91298.1 UDP-N-acetylmuramoylalanine--D-glutamate ligase [Myroides sp. ZB35]EHO04819.1 UDP-N-acetylmuramoylalanine-D-glutamate ligase [Myroides odoratimimus CIP 101113]EHO05436.1 UDP-N-acetylmuramoylalanine-D-glutamate ligase [Myroides odoratimimus CCUG 12901